MPYDVNGRPVRDPLLRRLARRRSEDLTPRHPGLVPVAESDDDAAASSAVLDGSAGFVADAQSVLWHLLELPPTEVDRVLDLVGQDRYERVQVPEADAVRATADDAEATELVAVARVQTVDAMHVSQERSRMAGVTARHGGHALLWRVLQVATQ
ncbi:hypothetical protein P0W64_16630 [Tsukamurella sp. 8F]|uniref:hypothetical protein n=1 Tax=unclassified Tsukamurella TaxID=2633480 RepID=UPI0023B9A94E|nr:MULTISPECIES: hypothetical protein [unclassified Tsukamurella]MDF0532003.1 hypothetical protein [Tsukamurella sp. 8J]MDF0588408.1 hypothetical protein [Tsukamurella sp. 8F]